MLSIKKSEKINAEVDKPEAFLQLFPSIAWDFDSLPFIGCSLSKSWLYYASSAVLQVQEHENELQVDFFLLHNLFNDTKSWKCFDRVLMNLVPVFLLGAFCSALGDWNWRSSKFFEIKIWFLSGDLLRRCGNDKRGIQFAVEKIGCFGI